MSNIYEPTTGNQVLCILTVPPESPQHNLSFANFPDQTEPWPGLEQAKHKTSQAHLCKDLTESYPALFAAKSHLRNLSFADHFVARNPRLAVSSISSKRHHWQFCTLVIPSIPVALMNESGTVVVDGSLVPTYYLYWHVPGQRLYKQRTLLWTGPNTICTFDVHYWSVNHGPYCRCIPRYLHVLVPWSENRFWIWSTCLQIKATRD